MKSISKFSFAIITACSLSLTSYAQQSCQNIPMKIKVDAMPLKDALTDFSHQVNCKVDYQPSVVKGLKARPVNDKLAPVDALAKLVQGTGLEAHTTVSGLRINKADQEKIGLKAATLQAKLGQAVRGQLMKQSIANTMYVKLDQVRTSVVEVAKLQGMVSAAEKASYQRTFKEAENLLSKKK